MRNFKKIFLVLLIFCSLSASVGAQSAYYGKIKKYCNLYRLTSSHSAILAWLKENTKVFVISDVAVNGFLPVIYIESGVEGYIAQDMIFLTEKVGETPLISFAEMFSQNSDTVVLTVKNLTNRTLTLKIDKNNYTISGTSQQRIILKPGSHKYLLFGPKFLPLIGTEILNKGQNSTWNISAMALN